LVLADAPIKLLDMRFVKLEDLRGIAAVAERRKQYDTGPLRRCQPLAPSLTTGAVTGAVA
jgi:hypothetical protein